MRWRKGAQVLLRRATIQALRVPKYDCVRKSRQQLCGLGAGRPSTWPCSAITETSSSQTPVPLMPFLLTLSEVLTESGRNRRDPKMMVMKTKIASRDGRSMENKENKAANCEHCNVLQLFLQFPSFCGFLRIESSCCPGAHIIAGFISTGRFLRQYCITHVYWPRGRHHPLAMSVLCML